MKKVRAIVAFAVLHVLGLTYFAEALDLEQVYEGPCSGQPITVDPNLNETWVGSHLNWYVTAASKYQLYRVTQHHFGGSNQILKDMPEHTFYYESCLNLKGPPAGQGVVEVMGYEPGRVSLYNLTAVDRGTYEMVTIPYNTIIGRNRHHITLTDNKSFMFFTCCNENQKFWDVYSLTDSLSPEAIQQIEKHAVEQGFDKKQFVFLKFDSCKRGVLPEPGQGTEPPSTTITPSSSTLPPPTDSPNGVPIPSLPFNPRKNRYASSHFGSGPSFKRMLNTE